MGIPSSLGSLRLCMVSVGVALFVAACGNNATMTPRMAHYEPPEGSWFRITFDYPSSWVLHSLGPTGAHERISVQDPAEPTGVPGSAPDLEVGVVILTVDVVDPSTLEVDSRAQDYLRTIGNIPQMTVLGDRSLRIDGHPARWITVEVDPRPALGQMVPMLGDTIYLQVGDRLYALALTVAQDDRQGEFGRGFDALIASIEVIE